MKNLQPKNIIVHMPNWIGDLVMATPILADLKAAYPKASLTAMCQGKGGELLEADPSLNEIFCFSRSKQFFRRISERNIVEKLRRGQYDLGILLTNSFSSAWRFWLGKVQNKIGFRADGRSLFLDYPISFPKSRNQQHLVRTYKALLEPLEIPYSQTPPKLYLKETEKKEAWESVKRFDIKPNATLIGINPGAAYGSAKCWLPERFREIAERLIQQNPQTHVLFFGDMSHKNLMNQICKDLPSRVVNLAGQTDLRELMALISICSVFLTNDSGPMHIADALNVPLLALFGSTDPIQTGPYSQPNHTLQEKVACSPCFKRICPIDFPCMKGLTVDRVFEAVLKRMNESKPC